MTSRPDSAAFFDPSPEALRACAFRLASVMFGRDLADDVAQEVMLRLLVRPDHYDLASRDPLPLLVTVVRTAGIDLLRRRDRLLPCGTDVPEPRYVRADPVGDQVIDREQLREVGTRLRSMSPRSLALLLHVAHGGTLRDAAATYDLTPNAAAVRVFRIRRCLGGKRGPRSL
jgi:DNA-directed RNA polymerase specialized sigma24 family protein